MLSVLPGYVGTGFYGVSADVPYFRKKTMGCLVQGDNLNQADSLEFRIMRNGDMTPTPDPDVRPCLLVGPAVYGSDFSFSLVFLAGEWAVA
jgi:hypothetical protein